jgi:hypothetical protein
MSEEILINVRNSYCNEYIGANTEAAAATVKFSSQDFDEDSGSSFTRQYQLFDPLCNDQDGIGAVIDRKSAIKVAAGAKRSLMTKTTATTTVEDDDDEDIFFMPSSHKLD